MERGEGKGEREGDNSEKQQRSSIEQPTLVRLGRELVPIRNWPRPKWIVSWSLHPIV